MDRKNSFYKQLVTDAHVDTWFDLAEAADRNLALDVAMFGVVAGLAPSYTSGSSITITKGRAYDQAGRRINAWSDGAASKSVDLATATDTTPTAVSAGQERWVSVFAKHGRILLDPQTDGYLATVYYDTPEGLNADGTTPGWDKFLIVAGTSAPTGTATRPALLADAVLVCDFKRTPSDAANVLDTTRRQAWVNINDHVAGTAGKHNASAILITAISAWLDGLTNADTDVAAMVNKIIADLSDATGSTADGASRIGAAARGAMSAGSVASQLLYLVTNSVQTGVANTFTALQTMSNGLTVDTGAGEDFKVRTNVSGAGAYAESGIQFLTDAGTAPSVNEYLPLFEAPATGSSAPGVRAYASPSGFILTVNARMATNGTSGTWVSDVTSKPSVAFSLEWDLSNGDGFAVYWKGATGSAWNASAWDTCFRIADRAQTPGAAVPLINCLGKKTTLNVRSGVIEVETTSGASSTARYHAANAGWVGVASQSIKTAITFRQKIVPAISYTFTNTALTNAGGTTNFTTLDEWGGTIGGLTATTSGNIYQYWGYVDVGS